MNAELKCTGMPCEIYGYCVRSYLLRVLSKQKHELPPGFVANHTASVIKNNECSRPGKLQKATDKFIKSG